MDFSKIRNYLFIALLAGVTIVFFWLLKPFAYPIFWAAVIAALFYPAFLMIDRFVKHRNVSAFFSVVIITLVILIPLMFITALLLRESITLYNNFSAHPGQVGGATITNISNLLKNSSFGHLFNIDEQFISENLSKIVTYGANFLVTFLKDLTQNSVEFVIMFIVTLYTSYFFLRDGEKLIAKLMYLSPLGSNRELSLYRKFTTTASSVLRGTILIGGVQGILGGIAFAIAGIDSAIILGIIMMFASIVPGIGSAIIWFPVGIYLLVSGQIWQGITVLVIGGLVISTVDNLLRPVLVGKEIKMHPLLILFSTLGGIALFDITGFLIGPIIASLFMTFWEMYEEYFKSELVRN